MARTQDLPKLGEALGRGVREAKSEAAKAQDEIKARVSDPDAPGRQRATATTPPEPIGDPGRGA